MHRESAEQLFVVEAVRRAIRPRWAPVRVERLDELGTPLSQCRLAPEDCTSSPAKASSIGTRASPGPGTPAWDPIDGSNHEPVGQGGFAQRLSRPTSARTSSRRPRPGRRETAQRTHPSTMTDHLRGGGCQSTRPTLGDPVPRLARGPRLTTTNRPPQRSIRTAGSRRPGW